MNIGTHRTHCCKHHGCKYGNSECPVNAGTVEQDYPCEDCQEPQYYTRELTQSTDELLMVLQIGELKGKVSEETISKLKAIKNQVAEVALSLKGKPPYA